MVKIEYALINLQYRTEILVTLALHRKNQILALFSTEQQAVFFKDAFMNSGYTSINTKSFDNFLSQQSQQSTTYTSIVIMDIPPRIQTLTQIIKNTQSQNRQIIIFVGKLQKKYINFISKKIQSIQLNQMNYSIKKFTDFNYKLKKLVQQSYDLNRQAFYAYGSFLNNFRQNLLKTIFITESIDVHGLAKGFGFEVAPRVKEGKFCNQNARLKLKSQKKLKKIMKNKQKKVLLKQQKQKQDLLKSKAFLKKSKIGQKIKSQKKKVQNQKQTGNIKKTKKIKK